MPKNLYLKTLYIYNGIFVFASGLLGPLYAIFVNKFEKDVFSISLSWAAFLIATTICLYFVSMFKDKPENKKAFLILGFLIRAIVWILFIFIGNIWQLIILQIILGIGEAIGTPAFESLFAEHLDEGGHLKDYSRWKLIVNLATGVATVVGGLMVKYFGFEILFLIMSLLAIVSLIGTMTNLKIKIT